MPQACPAHSSGLIFGVPAHQTLTGTHPANNASFLALKGLDIAISLVGSLFSSLVLQITSVHILKFQTPFTWSPCLWAWINHSRRYAALSVAPDARCENDKGHRRRRLFSPHPVPAG